MTSASVRHSTNLNDVEANKDKKALTFTTEIWDKTSPMGPSANSYGTMDLHPTPGS